MKKLFALLLVATAPLIQGAETPTITISKSDKLAIAVTNLPADISKVVQNDLTMSGYFKLVPAAAAGFLVSGGNSSGALTGKVEDRAGKVVLSQTFSGAPRIQAHLFADEIVETLTGTRGIAHTKLAFSATRTGKKEIYVADADGANVTQLTHDNNISVAPALSRDGRSLVYTGYKCGYADVYEIDLASGNRNRIIKFPGTNSGAA